MATDWLKDAVFYQIYPQSFQDTTRSTHPAHRRTARN